MSSPLSSQSTVAELVAYVDDLTVRLEDARLDAEEQWAEYERLAAEMVKLNHRWGVAIRQFKAIMPEAGEPRSAWTRFKEFFGA